MGCAARRGKVYATHTARARKESASDSLFCIGCEVYSEKKGVEYVKGKTCGICDSPDG